MTNTPIRQRASSAVRDHGIGSRISAGLVAIALLLLGRVPQAATGTLVPALYQTVLDSNGNPISGAKVCTYLAGTSTPTPTYTDVALTVPSANPIVADSAGRWSAFLTPGTSYKFTLQDATGTPGLCNGANVRTVDNVVGTPAAAVATTGSWVPSAGGTATYSAREGTYVRVGALVLARGTFTVNVLGTGSINQITGLPFPVSGFTPLAIGNFGPLATAVVWLGGYVVDGSTAITVVGLTAAGTSNAFLGLFGNGTTLTFSVVYQTLAP